MSSYSIARRFLALTGLGYIVAVVCVVAVIWATSQPFLRDAHRAAKEDLALSYAHAAAMALDETYDNASYLSQTAVVADLVTGFGTVEAVRDAILTWSQRRDIRQVQVLDYRGRQLFRFDGPGPNRALFHTVELRSGLTSPYAERVDEMREGQFSVRYEGVFAHPHVLIAIPIRSRGKIEGILAVEQILPLDEAGNTARLATPFQLAIAEKEEASGPVSAPVSGTPFHVLLAPDAAVASVQGAALVRSILAGLFGVLMLPFLAMGLFGLGHIVAPMQALAASREALSRQKDQLRQQKQELRELARIAELMDEAVIVTDLDYRILWTNKGFEELTGYTSEDARGKFSGHFLQGSDTDAETVARIGTALRQGRPVREEILNYHKNGMPYWVSLSITPLTDEDGSVYRFAAITSDITARRQHLDELSRAQREAEHHAMHDTMTGLPNRRQLDRVLERDVTTSPVPRTLIRIDLDFFKYVNDTHGHAAGDYVLWTVAKILRDHARDEDLAARVGGDEFVVLMSPGSTQSTAETLCARLKDAIRQDMIFEGKTCRVGASFGIASAEDSLIDNSELLVAADAALYLSKEAGRNRTTLYTPEVHNGAQEKRRAAKEIQAAIGNEEFEPFFQPQVCAHTRAIVGIEALVRWKHPVRGILAPDAFLPIAEQLKLVPEIDAIVYRKGLQAVQVLNAAGTPVPKVSFNVGAAQLEDDNLLSLRKIYNVGKTRIAFEVLESVLVEEQSSVFAFRIDQLRDSGFQIEVDDFGSGHASLVGLMQLRPDVMKLDQRLILPLTEQEHARITIQALVAIGKSLGIRVTAEGVETEEHADILRDLEVDTLQGYCFAPPLSLSALQSFFDEHAAGYPAPGPDAIVALDGVSAR